MPQIKLNNGMFALVDREDFEFLNSWKWTYTLGYAKRVSYVPKYKYTTISMHRQILNAPKGAEVDHINGNKLDNRRSNLRICTHSENQRNKIKRKDSLSKYKGVTFIPKRDKWQATIYAGRHIWLGYYNTEKEAAKVHDQAAVKYHKNFAKINSIK